MTEPAELFDQFVAAYPAARRQRGYMASFLFLGALEQVGADVLFTALAQHCRSEEWQAGFVPLMTKWLEEERWCQELPEAALPAGRETEWAKAKRLGLIPSRKRVSE